MNNITTPKPKGSKKLIALAAAGPVLALVFGIAIGAAAGGVEPTTASAERVAPAPVETVEVEVPGEVDRAVIEACQRAIEEWSSIAYAQNEQIGKPYNEIVLILHGQMMVMLEQGVYALNVGEIDRATAMLEQANDDLTALTSRVDGVSADSQTCGAG